jgi:hypothetical protein
MRSSNIIIVALALTLVCPLVISTASGQLPLEPSKQKGQSVTAAFEGWYRNPDGTFSLLVGYFNRNHEETVDIPVGPDNRIEPGGPDQGQPTHFLPRRNWGVFSIRVPADFGNKKLVWYLTAHDQPTEIPLHLKKDWEVEPYREKAQNNTPPSVKFAPDGPTQQGPPMDISASYEGTTSEPVTLEVWTSDDAVIVDPFRPENAIDPPVKLFWSKYRGPGEVAFDNDEPEVSKDDGSAMTTATFSEPGSYILRLQANDNSGNGGGGSQCCWTNAHVEVTISPGHTSQ